MKTMLIVLFLGSNGVQVDEKLEFEQPDMATCESVAEHLHEVLSVDDALKNVRMSINCVQV